MRYETTEAFARQMDEQDPLKAYRKEFHFPRKPDGEPYLYFAGNSLGLQPKKTRQFIEEELEDWANLGVEGHIHARHPWLPYHEFLTWQTARLVGAKPVEVVCMNSLTVNLHLMLVSFYRPTRKRFKILIEGEAFSSDQYAVASQARFHGFDPSEAIVRLKPREGESTIRNEDILTTIEKEGDSIALILLGSVNFLTGQAFDIPGITKTGHAQGCKVGFDLAHGAGNLLLQLHDWDVDFAVWCSYKYLNAGPGGIAGCFVHERHANDTRLPRFAGWWGHNKANRFEMKPEYEPLEGAEAWQLSNPPIFQLAALRASLEIFDRATMPAIRKKGDLLTGYLEFLLDQVTAGTDTIQSITPRDPSARGCHLSLRIKGIGKEIVTQLNGDGVICDFRAPDIIRVAPAPLYNSFLDVFQFVEVLRKYVKR